MSDHNTRDNPLAETTMNPDRRTLLTGGGLGMAALGIGLGASARLMAAEDSSTEEASPPAHAPRSEFVFSITARIDRAMTVGETARGTVRAIPITGGEVTGDTVEGRVIPGGADWQLTRADGVTEIEATYAIELAGSTLVKVINRGIIVPPAAPGEGPYFKTHILFEAPEGDFAWLNEAIFLSRVDMHPSEQNAVLVNVFRLI